MDWLIDLFWVDSVAHAVLLLGLVASTGLTIGSIRIRGINLGIAGVLFSGLIFGHLYGRYGIAAEDIEGGLNSHVMHFAMEFGLILFVYTIGVQVGPGFLASLRKQGLPLNIMAASIVLLGALITVGIHYVGKVDTPAAVGLFSGATTNTPSLGAAQQALKDKFAHDPALSPEQAEAMIRQPGLGYAVAYPFGIIGIILAMLIIRWMFRIDTPAEVQALAALGVEKDKSLKVMNIEVRNVNLFGKTINEIPALSHLGVVISRVHRAGESFIAHGPTVLQQGDVLLTVGEENRLRELRDVVGVESTVDVRSLPSSITARRVVVTRSGVLGKSIAELRLADRFGVMVTRLARAEIEIPPARTRLQFGDTAVVVGEEQSIHAAAAVLGNEVKKLNHTQIIPIFVGIVLGVILGSWPINIPGLTVPVKLGLAGGPLIVAIVLSRLGHIGPLVWHMPIGANLALREIGIVLFLACVGLRSGERFLSTLLEGDGLYWMLMGALITFVPIMVVGVVGRAMYKLNYLTLCGLLAGSMTDPPALAFAGTVTNSDAPSVSYATVYPLTMLLRVLCAQALVLLM